MRVLDVIKEAWLNDDKIVIQTAELMLKQCPRTQKEK